ncbi:MAG: hypothetical protein Q7U38_11240 [Methylobacter sp.]|nr:hypothetical protein [Methylobacter sp.]MDP2098200.1 hypothetical protein [Methylobacter sp.]MDP2428088.1 hypothetical protein [Methylobacter sp.]MDP3055127.1 hypothetical protein [Methylobacter sp.]MDP3360877.1 hypothetical protein [Methylobacter sp.]
MKTPRLPAILLMISCFQVSAVNASEHHSGHGGGSGGGGGGENGCLKPQLTKFVPANMTTVAPESEFSFLAFNVEKAGQIKVSVKGIPVEVSSEDKETFFLVKGKLPAELVNTTARINIKVTAKVSRCNGENGWLVKISE